MKSIIYTGYILIVTLISSCGESGGVVSGIAATALAVSALEETESELIPDPTFVTDSDTESGTQCRSFNFNIYPLSSFTTYACDLSKNGVETNRIMSELNSFWGSSVQACSCQIDALNNGCLNNAFVLQNDPGYIYYDANFQNQMDITTGNTSSADWLMGHEFGHNIQIGLNLVTFGKQRELQSDCLSGYFFGFKECKNDLTENELIFAMQAACNAGDPFASPFWQEGSHGTCSERVSATRQGFDGYRQGLLPGQACP